jgi:hypothetical protein
MSIHRGELRCCRSVRARLTRAGPDAWPEWPVLLYHAVCYVLPYVPPAWIAPFAVSPAVLAAHLDAVTASGRQALAVWSRGAP